MADRNCRPLPKILSDVDALALGIEGRKGYVLRGGRSHCQPSSRILGGSVNDLKTNFRDGIAVEAAIVRVEAHKTTA